MCVFQDRSRRSLGCKPGDRNLWGRDGGTQACIRCLGRRKQRSARGSDHRRFRHGTITHGSRRRNKEKGKRDKGGAPALLLTRIVVAVVLVVVRSVPGSRRPLGPASTTTAPAPVGVVALAFGSCTLAMRTERGVGLRPPEKGTAIRS